MSEANIYPHITHTQMNDRDIAVLPCPPSLAACRQIFVQNDRKATENAPQILSTKLYFKSSICEICDLIYIIEAKRTNEDPDVICPQSSKPVKPT